MTTSTGGPRGKTMMSLAVTVKDSMANGQCRRSEVVRATGPRPMRFRQHTTVSNPPFGPFSIGRTPPNHISIAMVNAVSMLGAPRNTSNTKGLLLWKSAKKENRQSSGFSSFIPPTRTHFIIAPRIGHWRVDPRKTMVGMAGSTKKRRAPAELNYCHNFKFCVTYI
jgi:hypothetical protein